MKLFAKIIASVSLMALIVPSIVFLAGGMELAQVKTVMLIATIVWFVAATVWMWHPEETGGGEAEERFT